MGSKGIDNSRSRRYSFGNTILSQNFCCHRLDGNFLWDKNRNKFSYLVSFGRSIFRGSHQLTCNSKPHVTWAIETHGFKWHVGSNYMSADESLERFFFLTFTSFFWGARSINWSIDLLICWSMVESSRMSRDQGWKGGRQEGRKAGRYQRRYV